MSIPIIVTWIIITIPVSVAADYYVIPLVVKKYPSANKTTIKFLIELTINVIIYGGVVFAFHLIT